MKDKDQVENEDLGLDFYCPKCYDMVNFYMDESWSQSSKANKFERLYKALKHNRKDYVKMYYDLQFEFEETKAIKEELEDKLFRLTKKNKEISNLESLNLQLTDYEIKMSLLKETTSILCDEIGSYKKKIEEIDNEKVAQAERFKSELESFKNQLVHSNLQFERCKNMNYDLESKLSSEIEIQCDLKTEIEWKTEEINKVKEEMEMIKNQLNSSFLDEMHDQLEDCKSQLFEMSDLKSQLEQANEHNTNLANEIESLKQEKNSEQEKKIAYFGQIQSVSDALVQKDAELEERSMEIKLLKSQLETDQSCLNEDATRLLKELETYHREFADLQAKFCEAISEKENLLKEIVELNRRQHSNNVDVEFQMKLEEKLNQLQTQLDKTKRMSGQFKGPNVGSHMNESFMVKLDHQIETQLQNKLNAIIEEKHKYLLEIQNLKMENAILAKEKRSCKEEHALNKQLQATIKQNAKDIAKLNDDNKSLKEANDFLSNQVNVLNDRIFELSNKENNETKKEAKNVLIKKLDSADNSSSPKHLNTNRSIGLADFDINTPTNIDNAYVPENKPKCFQQ